MRSVFEWTMSHPTPARQDAGLVTALALGCTVNQRSFFDRKHYFYADMPAGYQITQQRVPLAQSGKVVLGHGADETSVRVERLHLEHDSGKSIHTLSDRALFGLCPSTVPLLAVLIQSSVWRQATRSWI